ncbi:MAG TPA: hypothetical protein VFK41_04565 [Nocardioidaceae bacterium]|nr:hypothetical protein [Nocardioidaceae bacterium]
MSPRIDHRPPVIAFLVLVVLAIAVVGTNARAVDRLVVTGELLEVHVQVTGIALRPEPAAARVAADRVRPASRSAARPHDPLTRVAVAAAAASAHRPVTVARPLRTHGRHLGDTDRTQARQHGRRLSRGFVPLGRAFGLH